MDKLIKSSSDIFKDSFNLDDIYEIFFRISGGLLILLSITWAGNLTGIVGVLKNLEMFSSQFVNDLFKAFLFITVTLNLSILADMLFNTLFNKLIDLLSLTQKVHKNSKKFNKLAEVGSIFINFLSPGGLLYSNKPAKRDFVRGVSYLCGFKTNPVIDRTKLNIKSGKDFYEIIKQYVDMHEPIKQSSRLSGELAFSKSLFLSSLILFILKLKNNYYIFNLLLVLILLVSFNYAKVITKRRNDLIIYRFVAMTLFSDVKNKARKIVQ